MQNLSNELDFRIRQAIESRNPAEFSEAIALCPCPGRYLPMAVQSGLEPIARAALESGAHLFDPALDLDDGLRDACQSGNLDMLRLLLDYGLAPDYRLRCDASSLLSNCAAAGSHAAMRLFLQRGAGAADHAEYEEGHCVYKCFENSSVRLAIVRDDPEALRMLLEAGANPSLCDGEGLSYLAHAAADGALQCLSLLLACGSDPNQADERGRAPLHYALSLSAMPCAKPLLDAGADPLLACGLWPCPMQSAAEAGNAEFVRLALPYAFSPADPNAMAKLDRFAKNRPACARGLLKPIFAAHRRILAEKRDLASILPRAPKSRAPKL